MSSPFGPEARAAIIRHPFFLAGLATVGLLGLMAGVLVLFDSVSGDSDAGSPTVTVAQMTSTPGPIRLTAVASGVIGRTNHVATVRTAPGTGSPVLGTLPSNTDIEVDARTTDSNWLRVIFPPNSELHGWIDAADLELTGEASSLVVATAEPPPIIELPTESPDVLTAIAEQQTIDASAIETETPTPTPVGGTGMPDLVVGTSPVLNGGQLFVTVVNQGDGDAVGDIVVAVLDADGTVFLGGATLPNFTLPAGRSIDVGTGYEVTSDQTLLLIVDPGGILDESDNFNNRITIAIATGIPPTPDPFLTPEVPTEPPPEEPVVP
jgi:hypothetical protein